MKSYILNLRGLQIIEDHHISDFKVHKRSWKERFFTFPWKPFQKTRIIHAPICYIMSNGRILVSPATKEDIERLIFDKNINMSRIT